MKLKLVSVSTFSVSQVASTLLAPRLQQQHFVLLIHLIQQAMDPTWMHFIFDVTSPITYECCKFTCMVESVIELTCAWNSHIDKSMDINTFGIDNRFFKWIYLNLQSLFALIITIFMKILYFFIQFNVNYDLCNYSQSYYKIIYCYHYSFIFIALSMIISLIKMIRWMMFESIMFAHQYLNITDDENNLHANTNDTQPTINKKMDLYHHDCGILNSILMYFFGDIYSIYIVYQLIYYLYILKIFIIGQFSIIIIILQACTLILNYIQTQTMQYQSNAVNFIVLIDTSIVRFLIDVLVFKLVLLMVIVSITLIYHTICVNRNHYHYNQDWNIIVQGKFLCVLFNWWISCCMQCHIHCNWTFTSRYCWFGCIDDYNIDNIPRNRDRWFISRFGNGHTCTWYW